MPISENAPGGNQGFSFNRTAATSRSGNMGGRPGLNPLRLTTYNIVTAEEFQALKKIRDAVMARRGEVPVPVGPPRDATPIGWSCSARTTRSARRPATGATR